MARLKKPVIKQHLLCMRSNTLCGRGELVLIGYGKNTSLMVRYDNKAEPEPLWFSGAQTLEKFARSLLKALGKGDV